MKNFIVLICTLFLFCFSVFAQESSEFSFMGRGRGLLELRKYYGENAFDKGFNWDGTLKEELRIVQYGRGEFWASAQFQSVVARPYDRKIRVSGQVYILEGRYLYAFSPKWTGTVALSHISTHVTQDLINPFYMDLPELPEGLLEDANLFGVGITRNGTWGRGLPVHITAMYQPLDMLVPDVWNNERYVRPYYAAMDAGFWKSGRWQAVMAMETEFGGGKKSIGKLEVRIEMLSPDQKEGRFQFFFQRFFHGADIGSSPRFGFFPAELAVGFRTVFSQ